MKQSQGDVTAVKQFLLSEMGDLEKMKADLGGSTKEDHKYQVENFVLSVFAKVDKEERTCEQVTKKIALDFKRCGDFIVLLGMFGELEPEWEERKKYCIYKAATIVKALKSGEEPPRGNPFVQEEEGMAGEATFEEEKQPASTDFQPPSFNPGFDDLHGIDMNKS